MAVDPKAASIGSAGAVASVSRQAAAIKQVFSRKPLPYGRGSVNLSEAVEQNRRAYVIN
jgi:hypothetical protein